MSESAVANRVVPEGYSDRLYNEDLATGGLTSYVEMPLNAYPPTCDVASGPERALYVAGGRPPLSSQDESLCGKDLSEQSRPHGAARDHDPPGRQDHLATDWKVDQTESSEGGALVERSMSDLKITAGPYEFLARWEWEKSPQTCAAFERLLPYRQKIIHVRWSGESCWIPLGDYELGVGFEDATSVPQAGEILFYPGGYSETEILFPYSGTIFASKLGQLAGNHFLTVVEGQENLRALGELTLWEGAQDIIFERA